MNRSISIIIKYWVFKKCRIIVLLLWKHVIGRIAAIEDGICTEIDEYITAAKNGFQNG